MSEHWIRLLVKYKGRCSVCGKDIAQGEYALWSKTAKVIKHVRCEVIEQGSSQLMELNCFICGKSAGCASCIFEADCNRTAVSQSCICECCLKDKNVYRNYQAAFLAKMEKIKM